MSSSRAAEDLRARAEARARAEPEVGPGRSEVWTRQQIQENLLELRIHQIELELQNEALRETKADLAQALERYRDLFERSPVAYLLLDETGLVAQANQTAADLLGRPPGELEGISLASCLREEGHDDLHRVLRKALRSELPAACELRLLGPGERIVHLDALSSEGLGAGEQQVRVTLTDITELRRIQEGLARMQRLESLGALAGGMAHDYNSHLGIIFAACALLRQELSEEDSRLSLVGDIERAAEASSTLNAKVLAFGRRQVLQPEVLDLGKAVRASLEKLDRLLGGQVEVQLDLSPEPIFVAIDPVQLDQVVMNLALNARDAMVEGGGLQVSVGWSEAVDEEAEPAAQGYARLAFQDEGPGIPAEIRARIFEPFFTTKAEGRGTGLGLSTVNGIVGQSGGQVKVLDGAGGIGTCFEVYLRQVDPAPAKAVARPSKPRREPVAVLGRKKTILLVEDESSLRVLGTRILENHGATVLACGSGEEAVEIFRRRGEEIDLLYSDVVLPGMDGCELARRIREKRPRMPILLTSGHPRNLLDLTKIRGEGVRFLRKPSHFPELYSTIDELLEEG